MIDVYWSGLYVTFEPVTENVLQDGNKIDKFWRRIIYRLETRAVEQGLHRKPENENITGPACHHAERVAQRKQQLQQQE